jgi:hypothetical protein
MVLGGPLFTAIDSNYHSEESDLQTFIRGSQDRWVLAHMSIAFPDLERRPLKAATVQVNLRDEKGKPTPIAFSILPLTSSTPIEKTRKFSLMPNVQINGVVGISLGSIGQETTEHGSRAYIIGGPELVPNPKWEFRPTAAQELVGSSRLSMILKAPADLRGLLSVDLRAMIRKNWSLKKRVLLPAGDPGEAHVEAPF